MAAPLGRKCLCALRRQLLQSKHPVQVRYASKKSTADDFDIDPNYYHDYTVPYLPELEAQQSIHAKYPDIEISAEEFKFVERILPAKTVPPVKEHDHYPTPSGWVAPKFEIQPKEYGVRRTRNYMLPCYYKKHFDGQENTMVKKIHGDIWKFRDDAVAYLKERGYEHVNTQVHEIGSFVRFRGNHHANIAAFLLEKGF